MLAQRSCRRWQNFDHTSQGQATRKNLRSSLYVTRLIQKQSEILSTLQRAAENPAEHKAEQAPYKPQKQEVGQGEAEGGEGAEDAIAIEGKEEKEDIGLDGMPLKPGNKGEASEGPGI